MPNAPISGASAAAATSSAPSVSAAPRRRWAAVCGVALAAVLSLTGCLGDGDAAPSGTKPPASASASPSTGAPASAAGTPSAAGAPSASAAATPRGGGAAPATPRATASATPRKSSPAAATPRAGGPTAASGTTCEIRSNAGNCYSAGQFCRKADVGASTHDAKGRLIHCGGDGSRPRWHY
ncbi:hypothetical protein [Streptomyces sp. URMC 123]|uniref:hypothetical protein n=1 Tax=Streptomyces sp. URMC 123 TaxID=3423403 RepID=UPI003F1D0AC8